MCQLSDTHNNLPDIASLPAGDILIHTGDFSNRGYEGEIISFNNWLEQASAKYQYRIVILGNHDQKAIKNDIPRIRSQLTHATHVPGLEIIDLHGLNILCYPWMNLPNVRMHREDVVRWVKTETQRLKNDGKEIHILCAHSPAKYLMDLTDGGLNVGHDSVRMVLDDVRPQVFLFGHVHESHGYMTMRHRDIPSTTPSPTTTTATQMKVTVGAGKQSSGRVVSTSAGSKASTNSIGEFTSPVKAGSTSSATTTPTGPIKRTLLVNSSLCDYPTRDIAQCAHVIGLKRVVTEEVIPAATGACKPLFGLAPPALPSVKVTVSYTLQGIMQG